MKKKHENVEFFHKNQLFRDFLLKNLFNSEK